ncbi:MAG: CoB--CoM heterodisulfide reductase iron-sulfur subunit A family protein [Deltaproteobacteria bacterium]|nr:CoB--CoM heterodisulfide reductase iron-sulfur subunit A family protein [Deltaproteobacteria bacterium]
MTATKQKPILVVGAGIAGMTVALEAAEAGREAILVEKEPAVGGRVARIHNYFPKMCPPACGMELNVRRLEKNSRIRVLTAAEVTRADRSGVGWKVTVRQEPQYVNARCTVCGDCEKACADTVADPFNFGMSKAKAARQFRPDAWPRRFVLDKDAIADGGKTVKEACKFGAIDLDAMPREESFDVSAVVLATGWHPYPKEKLPELGGGVCRDVIANVEMERLASPSGPTGGKIVRPSDGNPPKRVAFVQCAGSRDVNHLAYCSGVCCLASLKHAGYVKEQIPDAEVTIFYIDRRTPGRNEEVLAKISALPGVKLVKGKAGKVESTPDGALKLRAEDVEAGRIAEGVFDLVVLATGMESNLKGAALPFGTALDPDGFGLDDPEACVFVAGVARRPEDVAASVRDATGVAARAAAAARRS